jgi:hypothetical protein
MRRRRTSGLRRRCLSRPSPRRPTPESSRPAQTDETRPQRESPGHGRPALRATRPPPSIAFALPADSARAAPLTNWTRTRCP